MPSSNSRISGAAGEDGDSTALSIAELSELFGGEAAEVERHCGSLIAGLDLRYRRPNRSERDQLILEALKKLEDGALSVAGPGRQLDWERGWRENLDALTGGDYALDTLVPRYVKSGLPIRLNGDYALSKGAFVRDYTVAFRAWLFHRYLGDADAIYEFGCGPAQHLAYLARAFPGKRLIGLDWAQSSVDIVEALARRYGWPMVGRSFDFFSPDRSLDLPAGSAVLTFGALEQTGDRWGPFLEFILDRRPQRCVHVEPLLELYDDDSLLDHLAIRYHRQRSYLAGLVPRLQRLAADGRIVIDKLHRHRFGTAFAETYSYVVWHPC